MYENNPNSFYGSLGAGQGSNPVNNPGSTHGSNPGNGYTNANSSMNPGNNYNNNYGNNFSSNYGGNYNSNYNATSASAASAHTAPKPEKKKSSAGKVMMAICLGLLFGLFAGAGFYSVSMIAGSVQHTESSGTGQNGDQTADGDKSVTFALPSSDQLSQLSDSDNITVYTTEQSDITEVVADVMPSMVSITEYYTYQTQDFFGQSYSQDLDASGSGIIIGETDDEFIIVTNNHVIEDAKEIEVTFIDDTVARAYLKGTDPSKDIGVISVLKSDLSSETLVNIKVAELGDSESLVLGQNVIAIGNALGYGQSVTTGIVSALNREITTDDGYTNFFIQTDAAINPGNSGGALLNVAGQVIGINSNKIGETRVEGMGYAIPISSVRDIIEDLMGRDTLIEVDEDDMGYIGIYMQEVTPEIASYYNMPKGIYITGLIENGGAEKAGLEVGDIITGFEGNAVTTNESLKNILKYYAVGDKVEVTFMRNEGRSYVEKQATVTLGKKPR